MEFQGTFLNEEPESVLLSDAIRYSIETEGCLLNKKLEDKATEFEIVSQTL
jgi:hypothetical protein